MKATEILSKLKGVLLSAEEEVAGQDVQLEEAEDMADDDMKRHYDDENMMKDMVSMEDFNKLKSDFAELKGMVETMVSEKKMEEEEKMEVPAELSKDESSKEELSAEPIVHSPEIDEKKIDEILYSQHRPETRLSRIFDMLTAK